MTIARENGKVYVTLTPEQATRVAAMVMLAGTVMFEGGQRVTEALSDEGKTAVTAATGLVAGCETPQAAIDLGREEFSRRGGLGAKDALEVAIKMMEAAKPLEEWQGE